MSSGDANPMEDKQVSEDEKVAGTGENKAPSHNPKEPDVDDSLSLIGGRIYKGEFPLVLPTQQQSSSEMKQKKFLVGLKTKMLGRCEIFWIAFLWWTDINCPTSQNGYSSHHLGSTVAACLIHSAVHPCRLASTG